MLALLVLAASPFVVIGVGMRGSTLQVSGTERQKGGLLGTGPETLTLSDVISPRVQQRGYPAAAQFTLDATLGETVTFESRPADDVVKQLEEDDGVTRTGRVRVGKRWLHELLLQAGHAWLVPSARKDAALVKLEAEARAAKRGLWADDDPIEPWLWRELLLLSDAETHVVHSGWECPHVQATQCKKCGGGRFASLDDAKAKGFAPHEQCMTKDLQRIAAASGSGPVEYPYDDDGRRVLPASPRRECQVDKDCALSPLVPCTCSPCGSAWRQAARKDVVTRMTQGFAKATCDGVGCPACAGRWVGTKAVCRDQQCTVE